MVARTLTCGVCGIDFCARSDAIYCSPACRQKAHRARTARRLGALAGRHQRAFSKPDVAGAIKRAKREHERALDLRRAATDYLEQCGAAAERRRAEGHSPANQTHDRQPIRTGRAWWLPN
ncbi:hypothetical protein A5707_19820 [Mycobacterium kyorinense]|uniref:Uncharacterized protein n=1 Tax=Mycobacterium kyorinense TaxID=487514 RepID=A0A1A2Z9J6_9MYCO|nr:hypothetical protein [Mycobacterium kyorinense]OBI47299.1 hypothetical protein A5707_19820 [Mycobacterium kyorinense]